MKIRPVETEFFHAGGRTDRHDEAKSRSSELCERVKKKVNLLFQLLKDSTCRRIVYA